MTPATIIKRAMADGVNLALSTTGTIKARGERAAVNRWLPVIREHQPGIVAALQEAGNEPLLEPATDARRQRVLELLAANPSARYAVVTDSECDSERMLLTLAIRGRATCELHIPRANYDPFRLLDFIERHAGIIH